MKLATIGILLVVLTSIVSCTFTENIYINPDGTGKSSIDMDGSALMAMAGDQIGDQLGGSNKKIIDSTFAFKKMFDQKRDSISKLTPAMQAELKKLENYIVHAKVNSDKNELTLNLSTPFKNVSELQDVLQTMQTFQKLESKSGAPANPLGDQFGDNFSTLSFVYNGNKFTRTAIIDAKRKALNTTSDQADMSKMAFMSSRYLVNYHFPKKIKKVSNPTAKIGADRKTVSIEYPFTDYMEKPDQLNLEVEFEK